MISGADERIIMIVRELENAITGLVASEREVITAITYLIAYMTVTKFDGDTIKAGNWLRSAFSDENLSVLTR